MDKDDIYAVSRVRHRIKARLLRVTNVSYELAQFIRITFEGDELQDFVSAAFDDHIKLFFTPLGGALTVLPETGEEGLVFKEGEPKPLMRDYTPRYFDVSSGQLVMDFALHEAGVATDWAKQAQIGDQLVIAGPRGSMIIPKVYDWHFLIGDESAYPAIARRLEELPSDVQVTVFLAVKDEATQLPLNTQAKLQIHWLYHHGKAAGDDFVNALATTDFPQGEGYVWAGGESSDMKRVYQHVVTERGFNKKRIKAASYWKRGSSAVHEVLGKD